MAGLLLPCALFMSSKLMAQQNVLLYLNPAHIDVAGGCGAEGTNMNNILTATNTVTPQSDNLDASWLANIPGQDAIVIPEQQNGQLVMSPAVLAAVVNFVNSGGSLIVHGGNRLSGRSETLLNQIFGWTSSRSSVSGSGNSIFNTAAGTCLPTPLPASLSNYSAVGHTLTSSLPPGAVTVYELSPTESTIWLVPVGSGTVTHIGWDYFSAGPGCSFDPTDWNIVLQGALDCGAVCVNSLFFSLDNNGTGLYSLDITTGAATMVGATGVNGSTVGLAPHPDMDLLFGSTPGNLSEVENDGSGATILGPSTSEGLAYDRDNDVLYAVLNGNFRSISQVDGSTIATLASTPGGADIEGIAYAGNGTIYGLAGFSGPMGFLYSYDIPTDTWSTIGYTGVDFNECGMAYDFNSGLLYAIGSQDNNLYSINPAVGTAVAIGPTGIPAEGGGLSFASIFPELSWTRNTFRICSGERIDYTISTIVGGGGVTFDMEIFDYVNPSTPEDMNDDNAFPIVFDDLVVTAGAPLNTNTLMSEIINITGGFDAGAVNVRFSDIRLTDSPGCTAPDTSTASGRTRVYPEPVLAPITDFSICSGDDCMIDADMLKIPSINVANAGYPVKIDWTVAAGPNISGAANGTIEIYDINGLESQVMDIVQTLTNTGAAPETVVYTLTPTSDVRGGFGVNEDCEGEPITVTVTVENVPDVAIARNTFRICSGEAMDYTITTNTPGAGVIFDLIFEQPGPCCNHPEDLSDDNTIPLVYTDVVVTSGAPFKHDDTGATADI